jgi:hypothetical protein
MYARLTASGSREAKRPLLARLAHDSHYKLFLHFFSAVSKKQDDLMYIYRAKSAYYG